MLDLAEWIRDLVGSESDLVFIERPTDDPAVRRTVEWIRSHPELVG